MTLPLAWLPQPVLAHAFGLSYALPVPLWLYLFGGAAAVVASFIVISRLTKSTPPSTSKQRSLWHLPRPLIWFVRCSSLAVALFVIITGAIGQQDFLQNFSVTFFWVIFLIGLTYVIAIIGNLWPYLNPVVVFLDVMRRLTGVKLTPLLTYPVRWSYYPALLTYIALIWLELLSDGLGTSPFDLAKILAIYGLLTINGIWLFGQANWLRYGEFFSVFFGLVSKLSPFEYRAGRIYRRRPLAALLNNEPAPVSLQLFILFMLASTAFDGLSETRLFAQIYSFIYHTPLADLPTPLIDNSLLLLTLLGFALLYWLVCWLMRLVVRSELTAQQLAARFAYSLIPIAVAYSVAHYITYLILNGQLIFSLISDPFGWGWNLFGTANAAIHSDFLNPAAVWLTEVGFIVGGHIAAVYIAHRIALQTWRHPRLAMISQYPMLVLMVTYTMTSLWIIGQAMTFNK